MAGRRVAIVPHTHWDREWHTAFEALRLRLVDVVDAVVDTLERDDRFSFFLLDGQTQLVDDYLALRPEMENRLRAVVACGRLAVGPFAVLPDEFLVSAETLARSLERGLARSNELGAVHEVGYLPDSFGHVDQMPQLLRLAGIDRAVVWRGVPAAIRRTAFRWRSPDGSVVAALYLHSSYANGRGLPHDPAALVARMTALEAELDGWNAGEMLVMSGGDHTSIDPALPEVVAAANATQSRYRFELTSLAAYTERLFATTGSEGALEHSGELRSAAHANLLAGVVSNRVDVRRAARAAEASVQRRAEPLDACIVGSQAVARALERASTALVHNSAHDSVCACSSDVVVRDVLARYRQARAIGDEVTASMMQELARRVGAGPNDVVVANLAGRTARSIVEIEVDADTTHSVDATGILHPVQELGRGRPEVFVALVTGAKAHWVADRLDDRGFEGRAIGDVVRSVHPAGMRHELLLVEADDPGGGVDCGPAAAELRSLGERGATIRVRVLGRERKTALVDTGDVPGLGWSTIGLVSARRRAVRTDTASPLRVDATSMRNDHLGVTIDPADGTWTLRASDGIEARALGRIVEGGDVGDTYTFSPPPDDLVVEAPSTVHTEVVEHGPLRARVDVIREYRWPVGADADADRGHRRTTSTTVHRVVTRLELRAHEAILRVAIEFENRSSDHRVRMHFPLPRRCTRSVAGAPFSVVTRPLRGEGGPHEHAVGTFPATDFVDAGDGAVSLALLTDGVTEYEIVDEGAELAVTLLRSTGYLARRDPDTRPAPAGPPIPTPDAQLLGPVRRELALALHAGGWEAVDLGGILPAMDDLPAMRAFGADPARASLGRSGSWFEVVGAEVVALRRAGDASVLRVVRRASTPGTLAISRSGAPATGTVVDLRGRPRRRFDGSMPMRPFEIATVRIEPSSTAPASTTTP